VLRKLEHEKRINPKLKAEILEQLNALQQEGYGAAAEAQKKPAGHRTKHGQAYLNASLESIRGYSVNIFHLLARDVISNRLSPSMRKTLDAALSKTNIPPSPSKKTGSLTSDNLASGDRSGTGTSDGGVAGEGTASNQILLKQDADVNQSTTATRHTGDSLRQQQYTHH
jgi:hypothetical protein